MILEKEAARLELIAAKQRLTVDELLTKLECGTLRLTSCEIYQVFLTEAACSFLKSYGINSFVRGKSYFAVDEDDAFKQFNKEFPSITTKLMVTISKV